MADKTDPYESGYRARLAGCYRVLCNYETEEILQQWQRGWDDADLMTRLDQPTTQQTYGMLYMPPQKD